MISITELMIVITMKTKTAITALGLALLTAGEAYAGSAEVMAGTTASTLDAKLSGDIASHAGFFLRSRTTVGYDGTVSAFELADVTYSLGKGFDVVAEVQMTTSVIPRAGVQYYHGNDIVAVYGLVTVDTHYAELTVFVQYTPKITEKMSGFAKLETIQDVGLDGYVWGTERARLGVGIKGYKVGLATDITHPDTTINPGLFVAKSF
jgi:hypothetical protein